MQNVFFFLYIIVYIIAAAMKLLPKYVILQIHDFYIEEDIVTRRINSRATKSVYFIYIVFYFAPFDTFSLLRYRRRRDDITTATPRRRFCCNCAHVYRPRQNNGIRLPRIKLRVAWSSDKRMIHLHIGTLQVTALH